MATASQTKKAAFTQEDVMKVLEACYEKCLNGIPKVSHSVEKMAEDYMAQCDDKEEACRKMMMNQIIKCTTSGFITGFGGVITLPVSVPANVGSVLYVQMRMIACAACMAGFDLSSDQTQTLVYACLAGVSINKILKQVGIKVGTKLANSMIKKIPGKVLIKINQKVGFRFITKAGTKGIINLTKLVPGVAAVVSGGFDYAETKIIANRAIEWFFKGNFIGDEKSEDQVVEIDEEDFVVENADESDEMPAAEQ